MKISVKLLLASFLFALFAFSCAEPKIVRRPPPKKAFGFEKEGWLDGKTFQVKVHGKPNPSASGFLRRRRQSSSLAIILAHKRTVKLMAQALGSSKHETMIEENFLDVIEKGNAVKKEFDLNDNCNMVYRIISQNLRKRIAKSVK